MDRIKPSWDDIKRFKNPLTQGELHLAEFLDKSLPDDWEIYVQPYLNGDRPDIVVLNEDVGMMIFEVKDWHPEHYHFEKKIVLDKSSGKRNSFKQYYVTDSRGKHKIQNPYSQVCRYRDNLVGLYLPYLGETIDQEVKELSAYRVGLYFHNMTTDDARILVPINFKHSPVIGVDYLDKKFLNHIVPNWNQGYTRSVFPYWADEIRTWLNPPFHSLEQGQDLNLTPDQRRHSEPSPHQHQRLRGFAGSGKTLVIAQRAASLAENGKKILVITYNITLLHYIRDHISRAKKRFSWDSIEFKHFHGLCRDYLYENEISWPTSDEDEDDDEDDTILRVVVPELVIESMSSGRNNRNRKYDAILIDEGQDFNKLWYLTLREFLTDNDEVLFVVDERQNLYNRDLSWIHSMSGTKFQKKWRELKESYRLPVPLIEKANQFADSFMDSKAAFPIPSDYTLRLPGIDPILKWQNLNIAENIIDRTWGAFSFLFIEKKIHPQDIVIIVPTHSEGWALVNFFKERGIQSNHVFEDEQKSHHNKKSFWMGDSRLKMCTIHSFKGWELQNVIFITPTDGSFADGSLDKLIYSAITRSRQNLIILNRNSRYIEYGKSWNIS